MMPRQLERKYPCSRCSEMCFAICYVGPSLVCPTCFQSHVAELRQRGYW